MNRQTRALMVFFVLAAFIAMPAYGQTQSGQSGQAEMQPSRQAGGQGAAAQGPLRASELMGAKVTDPQGNSVGTVGDLILSDQGDVEYLVLAQGGMFGFGNKMVPVPWDKVRSEGAGAVTLAVNQQKIKDAPSFSKSDWDQMAPGAFEKQVRGYFGEQSRPSNEPYQPGMEKQKHFGTDQKAQ